MRTIYLLRHGEYENPRHILPSRLPHVSLSSHGRQQMEKMGAYLAGKNITAIYASPILRTKQSARIIGRRLKKKIIFSKSLLEILTPVQGRDISIIKDIERHGDTFLYPPHLKGGGETREHVYDRMRRIKQKAMRDHYGNIVFVGHGDPLMIFSIIEQGKPLDATHSVHSYGPYIPKGGLIRMDYQGEKLMRIRRVNY